MHQGRRYGSTTMPSMSNRASPRVGLAVGVKGAIAADAALVTDPTTEGVAIDGVGLGGAGVTVSFDVVHESPEILLPPVDVRVP